MNSHDNPLVIVHPPESVSLSASPRRFSNSLGHDLDVVQIGENVVTLKDSSLDLQSIKVELEELTIEWQTREMEAVYRTRNDFVRGVLEPNCNIQVNSYDLSFPASVLQLFGQLPDIEQDFPLTLPNADAQCFLECLKKLHASLEEDGIPKPDPSEWIEHLNSLYPQLFSSHHEADKSLDRLARAEFSPAIELTRILLNTSLQGTRFRSRFRSNLITRQTCPVHGESKATHETRWFALPPELAVGEVNLLKCLGKVFAAVHPSCCHESETLVEFLGLPRFLIIFIPRNAETSSLPNNPFAQDTFRIPQTLDLSHYSPKSKESLQATVYHLHGFITQTSSTASPRFSLARVSAQTGPSHYLCYTKCQGGSSWHRCDEDMITPGVELGIGELKSAGVQVVSYCLGDGYLKGAAAMLVKKPVQKKTQYTETKVIGRGMNWYWS